MDFNLAVMLRESARRWPAKTAVILGDARLSYAQLDELSDRVAANLAAAGLAPGDRVALQLPNIPQFIVAYFGILKLGAVVVPMNVLLKAPEIEFQLEDSGARALITYAGLLAEAAKAAESAAVTSLYVVSDAGAPVTGTAFEALLSGDAPGPQLAGRGPEDPAVIIYTSGTTGTPKGAVLSHISLYMNADIPGRLFELNGDDTALVALPLFHVFGLSSVMNACVLVGAAMTLVPRFVPGTVLEIMQRDRVTVFMGVPTMFIGLLQAESEAGTASDGTASYDTASLRVATSGGAPIPAEVIDSFESRFGVAILEGYGLSESSSVATFNISAIERKIYSAGKPIWGTSVQIWDADSRPLPPGAAHPGEIVLRGVNIMIGYHNNPEATAKAFEGGWFHTGDIGYLDDDGFLFIIDRIKDLIIRGGYNVYPREVEEVLYAHPAVAEVAVIGVPDPRLGEEVHAVVAVKPGHRVTEAELIEFAKERAAAYKYPRTIEFRDNLPKNATGKILKKELRPSWPAR
jgi:long-chain acyl-CoA synthetase